MVFKIIIVLLASLLFFDLSQHNDKTSLLCHTWKQVYFKSFNGTLSKDLSKEMSKICNFNINGDYEEEMYNLKSGGKWYFNDEKTKFGILLNSFNGKPLPVLNDTYKRTNIIILKLNQDTLIYGHETYYGYGPNKVFGHDEWCFVRVK